LIAAYSGLGAAVLTHSTLPLNAEDQELPAVVVNNGADEPTADGGYSNLHGIDSLAALSITIYAQGSTQAEIAAELDRLRVAVHKALMASPQTLGLSFVIGLQYGGAGAPEYGSEGAPLAGRRELMFSVLYRMGLTDPE
jgi:hypothetical protein